LDATGAFERMNQSVDEDEHSIEMTLPYVAKIMEEYVTIHVQLLATRCDGYLLEVSREHHVLFLDRYKNNFRIVPVLVGSLTPEKEAKYGAIFSQYLADPANLYAPPHFTSLQN